MNKLRNLEKWTCPGIPENAREKEIREARNQVKMTLVVSLVMSCYVMLCHVISCYFMLFHVMSLVEFHSIAFRYN